MTRTASPRRSAIARAPAPRPASAPFGELLRQWRRRRGLSQLALALDASVSQRHLSFVESGRAAPSRDMVLRLAEYLDVPLRERNHLLLAAGYAPVYRESTLDDPKAVLYQQQWKARGEAIRIRVEPHDARGDPAQRLVQQRPVPQRIRRVRPVRTSEVEDGPAAAEAGDVVDALDERGKGRRHRAAAL